MTQPAACPVCGEQYADDAMFGHLRERHPSDDWGPFSTLGDGPTINGQIQISTGRRLAYALYIWPMDFAPRQVLRAMMPESGRRQRSSGQRHTGHVRSTHSRTSKKFSDQLYDMERAGEIARGERYIRILDRAAIEQRALRGVVGERVEFLAIEQAVAPAKEAVEDARAEHARAQALRDLQAVYDLMKADRGIWHGGKSSVRHVPHGWRGRPS